MILLFSIPFACGQTLEAHESEDSKIHAEQAAQIDEQAAEVAEIKAQVADLKARVVAALPAVAAEVDSAAAAVEPKPEPAPVVNTPAEIR